MILSSVSAVIGVLGIVVAQTGGDLPGWVGPVLTPTAAALLLVSGVLMRTKVHESDMERMWKLYEGERARAEASENREREALKSTLPALDRAAQALDRSLAAAQKAP